jgi:superfamily II DNA or RNA helicase
VRHPLFESLASRFDAAIRARGEDYYGAVSLAEIARDRVLAFVWGANRSRRYTVQLLFQGSETSMSCTCPYFLDGDRPCKHLWAVLRRLDKLEYFTKREAPSAADAGTGAPLQRQRQQINRPGGSGAGLAPRPQPEESQYPEPDGNLPLPFLPEWKRRLGEIRKLHEARPVSRKESWPPGRELLYVLDLPAAVSEGAAVVTLLYRDAGEGLEPRELSGPAARLQDLRQLPDTRDQEILAVVRSMPYDRDYPYVMYSSYTELQGFGPARSRYRLTEELAGLLVPKMCATGRLFLKRRRGVGFDPAPIRGEEQEAEPWEFRLRLAAEGEGERFRLEGMFKKGSQRMALTEPEIVLQGGLLLARGRLDRYSPTDSCGWIKALLQWRQLLVTRQELSELMAELLALPALCPLEIDTSVPLRCVDAQPRFRLTVSKVSTERDSRAGGGLVGKLSFDYQGFVVDGLQPAAGFLAEEEKLVVLRRSAVEAQALARLRTLGFRLVHDDASGGKILRLAARRLPAAVEALLGEGWTVEAEGKRLRSGGQFDIHVVSGIDWFEVQGGLRYGEGEDAPRASLPELLRALRRGSNTVRLGDGTFGILPEHWLRQQGFLLQLGEVHDEKLRFQSSQALLIDLFLQAQPRASCDELFKTMRDRLQRFSGVRPLEAPPGFVGRLRGYQQEGLGWFRFLDEFAFGGCLADDMGLGKTVQVLALLESLRDGGGGRSPSLVVVPRSLLFNWQEEAARFVPRLKVLPHGGPWRAADSGSFGSYDVVVTTYGTMRNDVAWLKGFTFDYVILDEAQVIKNAGSSTAKAARLLQGRRRLALSGTPIENHLGELWSLFEFLNPGMLGGVSFFRKHLKDWTGKDEGARALLARCLRPFILRRTKEQVAPELPEKVEQTLFCQLGPAERRRYNELREFYRTTLRRRIKAVGLEKAKMHLLEALLRLRQAACHPGLLDKSTAGRPSAKMEMLLQQLVDVLAEGRKALVFSQFTSLLSILRDRLDRLGMVYEYLDGQTTDRSARVSRFQQDPACSLFLISLKAGGLGLNLTAAEYVFLLDPWWNPASETQAIDRAHRIGQHKKVFAYRLISKDTVEEKVLQLQEGKRELAEAIIGEDNRLIGQLSREDLELLLS